MREDLNEEVDFLEVDATDELLGFLDLIQDVYIYIHIIFKTYIRATAFLIEQGKNIQAPLLSKTL